MPDQEFQQNQQQGEPTSKLEWIFAVISAVVVLGVIAILFNEALSEPDTPPQIEIIVENVQSAGSGYVVEFWARNLGQTTAASLMIEGELKSDSGSIEKSTATIDYVPAEASRKGGLFFSHDPRDYRLEIKPRGYDVP